MRTRLIILLLSIIAPLQATSQLVYLVRSLGPDNQSSEYTWITPGQPIGIRSEYVNLNFDESIRPTRFVNISRDTLIVLRINSFRDTIITHNKSQNVFLELRKTDDWEHAGTIARHKRIITERFQIAVETDTLFIPVGQISSVRTYRRSVQHLKDSGMEFGALFPPVTIYLIFIAAHPARNYRIPHWKFMKQIPFRDA